MMPHGVRQVLEPRVWSRSRFRRASRVVLYSPTPRDFAWLKHARKGSFWKGRWVAGLARGSALDVAHVASALPDRVQLPRRRAASSPWWLPGIVPFPRCRSCAWCRPRGSGGGLRRSSPGAGRIRLAPKPNGNVKCTACRKAQLSGHTCQDSAGGRRGQGSPKATSAANLTLTLPPARGTVRSSPQLYRRCSSVLAEACGWATARWLSERIPAKPTRRWMASPHHAERGEPYCTPLSSRNR